MKDLTLSETLLAKHAYEHFLALLGVESKAYHADNGRFTDKGFRDDCTSSNQTITFCGIALPVIRRLPFVALEVIIKMV
jgi:hypothetical protein